MNSSNLEKERLLQADIKEAAESLLAALTAGNVINVRNLITNLAQIKEESLYQELGKLTRELHDSIKAIDADVTTQEIPKAQGRLSDVISMTERAANLTMDGIEATIPIANNLATAADELHIEWEGFKRRKLGVEEFDLMYQEMLEFLANVKSASNSINRNLQDMLIAQNYQDLSGQAIKKVMQVVGTVEGKLLKLIALSNESSISIADGDNICMKNIQTAEQNICNPNNTTCTQDQVDDLLSSLGF